MYRYRRQLLIAQILADAVLINIGFAIAYYVRYSLRFPFDVAEANFVPYEVYIPISLGLTLLLVVIYKLEGLYSFVRGRSWLEEFYDLFSATFTGMVIMVGIFFVLRPQYYSRLIYGYAGIAIVLLLLLARMGRNPILAFLRRRKIAVDRVLIVGTGEIGRAILRNIIAEPALGYEAVGFLDDDPDRPPEIGRYAVLGPTAELRRVIVREAVDEVVIALPWSERLQISDLLACCETARVRVKIVPDLFQLSLSRVAIDAVGGIPLLTLKDEPISGSNRALKRAIDIVLGLFFLVVLAPLLAFVAVLIKLDSPGPAIFRQPRAGRNGHIFITHKFRTMYEGADEDRPLFEHLNEARGGMFKIRNDPRRTRIGKYLRRFSIDELPQFWDVLRGDMSLVGPRPALLDEAARYKEWHKRRLEVAPGITGLWQVSGRSDLSFDEMVLLDTYYIENWSPWLDIKIMIRTIPSIILARGAY